MDTKTCTKCGVEYPATYEFFHRRKESKDGLRGDCKLCNCKSSNERGKKYRTENSDLVHAQKIKWYSEHKEYYQKWREENKEYQHEYDKKRTQKKLEYLKNKNKRWYQKNTAYAINQSKERYRDNKQTVINQKKEYSRKKYRENIAFRINGSIRTSVGRSLKRNKRGMAWEKLTGYNVEKLMIHLESLFQPGMTWDNYGFYGWHIDHKRPVSSFNYTSPYDEEFKKCWALENLQPLWAGDNLSKGGKWQRVI